MTSMPMVRRRRGRLVLRNTAVGWSFLLPNFAGFAVLTLVPVALLFYYAFTSWNVFGGAEWTGLDNFRQLSHDRSFRTALTNTVYYTVFHIPLTLVASLGLALLLNRKLRGVAFFRTVAFFPYITSIVALAQVWNMLFSPGYGPINQVLRAVGVDHPPGWTTSADWSMPAVIIVGTWREAGYYMLLFLAGLQTIPTQLYEAAKVDGASVWQTFSRITMPLVKPALLVAVLFRILDTLRIFDLPFVLVGPNKESVETLSILAYLEANQTRYGPAAAYATLLFIYVAVVAYVFVKLLGADVFGDNIQRKAKKGKNGRRRAKQADPGAPVAGLTAGGGLGGE